MMRPRKVPVRSCVACRTSGDKRSLLRIVRTPTGEIVVDTSGKMAGRGAYLCPTRECLKRAVKEKRLSRALRAEVPEEIVNQIEETFEEGSDTM